MESWIEDAFFYHVYPLGYCGAPARNDFTSPPQPRLEELTRRLDSIASLGVNALFLGPVFESASHGYDTVDHRTVDRRLGTNADLARLSREARARGIRLVLDGVFNHVGRDHAWFRRLRAEGQASACAGFFKGIDFTRASPAGDPFSYECWNGHASLPSLQLSHPQVRGELLGAVQSWIDEYDIDGLRLDAADCVDLDFQAELAAACRARKPGFWLMGEIIHGDYRRWAGGGPLDSVTNYECWKGLWSSLKDANYFEIAWALKRQFGEAGIYRDLRLYSFADNHDVDRAASLLPGPGSSIPSTACSSRCPASPRSTTAPSGVCAERGQGPPMRRCAPPSRSWSARGQPSRGSPAPSAASRTCGGASRLSVTAPTARSTSPRGSSFSPARRRTAGSSSR